MFESSTESGDLLPFREKSLGQDMSERVCLIQEEVILSLPPMVNVIPRYDASRVLALEVDPFFF